MESEALYDLLERDVVPTFYDRGADGLPRRWIARMKASIGSLCHFFNTHRMVREYAERFYLPAAARYRELAADEMARSRALAAWKARVQESWSQVRIEAVEAEPLGELHVGDEVHAQARVHLGNLTPDDVRVELYLGRVDADGKIVEAEASPMQPVGPAEEGGYLPSTGSEHWFEARAVPCRKSGLHGYTVRVLPHHPDLTTPFLPGLITWAGPNMEAR